SGFFRRWLVVPFERRFDEATAIPRKVLDARLSTAGELSGLLNLALDALPQGQSGAFRESQSTRDAHAEFRRVTDPFAVWLEANTVDTPNGLIVKETLRNAYAEDCRNNGRPTPSESAFTDRLRALRPNVEIAQRRINGAPKRCFLGIGLRSE